MSLTESNECPNIIIGLKHYKLYILMFIAFTWAAIGLLVAGNVKNYGNINIGDDQFLTTVGSLASVANSLARLVWGFLLDKFNFKVIVSINIVC